MTLLAPARAQQSYRHEAFFWHDPGQFIAATVSFVRDGLAAGEPVLVALTPGHTQWLQDAIGEQAEQVEFVDMADLGRNPVRLMPAIQRFLTSAGQGRPARGIGEPIWPGRRHEELVESQLHEALLNVAVDPDVPFWLICPYDTETLCPMVIEEAHRSHPAIIGSASYHGSSRYAGRAHAASMFASELALLPGHPRLTVFNAHSVDRLYSYLKLELYVTGLTVAEAAALAAAIQLLATNSVCRGAATGTVSIWNLHDALICEVADDATVDDVMLGRRASVAEEQAGLSRAHDLGDLVQVRSSAAGTRVRIHIWR